MKTDYECAEIVDDSSSDEEYVIQPKVSSLKKKVLKKEKVQIALKSCYNEDEKVYEIGVDEAGRGPLFGRVYTAAVVLPKDDTFDFTKVKDSKKFHSKKKIEEAAEYIKQNALAWHVSYEDEKKIDEINILQATQSAMHKGIKNVLSQLSQLRDINYEQILLLVDGNYFNPFAVINKNMTKFETIKHQIIEGGDNKYASIAAASILAKVERDKYIDKLCEENPELSLHYGIDSNKGYGVKRHIDGIKEHGITIWHRRSFAPCKNYV